MSEQPPLPGFEDHPTLKPKPSASYQVKANRPSNIEHHVNKDQLKMIMTGKELMDAITWSGDIQDYETMDDMWKRKERESTYPASTREHGSGVFESLKQTGYRGDPITLIHTKHDTEIADGHHRIAAAARLERQGNQVYIPVEHDIYDFPIDTNNWWDLKAYNNGF